MGSVKKEQKIFTFGYLLLLVISTLICFIQEPRYAVAYAFAFIYIILAYKCYRFDFEKIQISSLLIFAIINSNASMNLGNSTVYVYYIVVFIFLLSLFWNIFQDFIKNKKITILSMTQLMVIALVGLYIIFSTLTSDNLGISMGKVKNHIISFATLIIAFIELKKYDNFKAMIKFLKYLFLGVALLGLLEIIGVNYGMRNHFYESGITPEKYPHVAHVPVTFFYNPNNYSVFLVMMMVIFISDIIYKKINYKNLFFYILGMINIIFAMSRTAWISLVFTFVFMIIFFIISKEKIYMKRAVILTVMSLIIYNGLSLIPAMGPFYGKMNQLKEITSDTLLGNETGAHIGQEGSVNVRLTLITDVLEGVVKEKKYLGFGPGMTSEYIKYRDNTYGIYSLHSLLLEILGDYGVIMLAVFAIVLISQGIRILKKYLSLNMKKENIEKKNLFIGGVWLFTLIILSFAPSTVGNFPIFWIGMGGAFSLGSSDMKDI
ncbi:O-antigen ligase family protein [uncultured Clostridium sp.]|uniref:O-antigen ligase family protein n=1 Tax=uncultured Clostridium sp. TaxID=59620 RepID=UPI003217E69F